VKSEQRLLEAGDSSGTQRKGNARTLETATKQRLAMSEDFTCTEVSLSYLNYKVFHPVARNINCK
jgi:hypothetical protein